MKTLAPGSKENFLKQDINPEDISGGSQKEFEPFKQEVGAWCVEFYKAGPWQMIPWDKNSVSHYFFELSVRSAQT